MWQRLSPPTKCCGLRPQCQHLLTKHFEGALGVFWVENPHFSLSTALSQAFPFKGYSTQVSCGILELFGELKKDNKYTLVPAIDIGDDIYTNVMVPNDLVETLTAAMYSEKDVSLWVTTIATHNPSLVAIHNNDTLVTAPLKGLKKTVLYVSALFLASALMIIQENEWLGGSGRLLIGILAYGWVRPLLGYFQEKYLIKFDPPKRPFPASPKTAYYHGRPSNFGNGFDEYAFYRRNQSLFL